MLFDQSFISRPVASPDLHGIGGTHHHSFSSFASPSSELFLDNSLEDVHSSSPPDSPGDDAANDLGLHHDAAGYPPFSYPRGVPLTPEEEEDYTMYSAKSSSSRRHSLHRLTSAPSFDSFDSATSADERIDELQKANAVLVKKLRESTRELEHKLSDHEAEVDELQNRIEELRGEVSAARREEKEMKVKEVCLASLLVRVRVGRLLT